MAENLGLLNPYLVTGIGNNGAYNQPSQVGKFKDRYTFIFKPKSKFPVPDPTFTPQDTAFRVVFLDQTSTSKFSEAAQVKYLLS